MLLLRGNGVWWYEYAHAKGIESTLRASVTILNKLNLVFVENIPAYLLVRGNKKKKRKQNPVTADL